MEELVIKSHSFENAKRELKKFSEQTTTDLDLTRVDDSKDVLEILGDWFMGRGIGKDHMVTGEEFNELVTQIQTHIHSINDTEIKLVKEFGQVYNALEALDKDYIQAILSSIKATEETSQGFQKAQEDIKVIVENQRKTLEELKKFKQKLVSYVHLDDIDKIWKDVEAYASQVNELEKRSEGFAALIQENKEEVNEKISDALQATNTVIESFTKRIKYVYLIAGGSAGLAIIELILLFMKVI